MSGRRILPTDFIFVLNFEINPADSLISLGDTLWLTAEFDNKIEDFISKEKFELIDFNFRTLLGFFDCKENPSAYRLNQGQQVHSIW